MYILNGINVNMIGNIMSVFGIKKILEDTGWNIWWERRGNYNCLYCITDCEKNILIDLVYQYLLNLKNTFGEGKDIVIPTFTKNGKNLFVLEVAGQVNQADRVKNVFQKTPNKQYIENTLYKYPFILEETCLKPIVFAEENQRGSYKSGCYASNTSNFPLNCNRVIQSLMWIGIINSLNIFEVDNYKQINETGFYFIKEFINRSGLRPFIKIILSICDDSDNIILRKQYKQEISGNSYFYWAYERDL